MVETARGSREVGARRSFRRGRPPAAAVTVALALASLLAQPSAKAAPRRARRLRAHRVEPGAVHLDGRADDAAWRGVQRSGQFVQRSPHDGAAPTEQTRFAVAYDHDALYLLVEALDRKPRRIYGLLTRRDEGSSSDWIHVWLDTHDDDRTAYRFSVNPLGVEQDARVSEDGQEDTSWNAVWEVETRRHARGWTAEFRIPFSQLGYQPAHRRWGIQVARHLYRTGETSYFSPFPKTSAQQVSHFGELLFAEPLPDSFSLQLTPYARGSLEIDDGQPHWGWGLGGNARFGLGAGTSVELAINPDFGQVESDPSELNLSAFETFYPEKRPFFLEDAEIFRYPLGFGNGDGSRETLFYSRRIGRAPSLDLGVDEEQIIDAPAQTAILGATRITTKTTSGWSVGVLQALTARETAEVEIEGRRETRLAEPLANALVARATKEYRHGQTRVGAMLTHLGRQLEPAGAAELPREALSGGLDLEHRQGEVSLLAKLYGTHLTGSPRAIDGVQRSSTHYLQRPDAYHVDYDPQADTLSGLGVTLVGGKLTGSTWRGAWGGSVRSPGLDPNDLGYLKRADEQFGFIWLQYRQDEPSRAYKSFEINGSAWAAKTFGPELVGAGGDLNTFWVLPDYASIRGGLGRNSERLNVTALRGGPALKTPGLWQGWLGVGSDDRRRWVASLSGNAELDDEASRWALGLSLSNALRPVPPLQLSAALSFAHQIDGRHYIDGDDPRGTIVGDLERDTVSLTVRGSWAMLRDLTLQLYLMPYLSAGTYHDFFVVTDPRADAFADRFTEVAYDGADRFVFEQLRSNLVLRWEYLPGSLAYLVWSHEQSQSLEERGILSLLSDLGELLSARSNDVIMAKLSYWLALP